MQLTGSPSHPSAELLQFAFHYCKKVQLKTPVASGLLSRRASGAHFTGSVSAPSLARLWHLLLNSLREMSRGSGSVAHRGAVPTCGEHLREGCDTWDLTLWLCRLVKVTVDCRMGQFTAQHTRANRGKVGGQRSRMKIKQKNHCRLFVC